VSGNEVRQQAINAVTNRTATATTTGGPLSEIWATDVFSLATMEECLSKNAFKAMKKTCGRAHRSMQQPRTSWQQR
jgi:glutamine synthetase